MTGPRIDLGNGHVHEPAPEHDPGPDTVDECGNCGQQEGHKPGCRYGTTTPIPVAEAGVRVDDDPGPEPTSPTVEAPLTLKQRIANALDRGYRNAGWDPESEVNPEPHHLVDAIHAEVSAGADFESERIEGAVMTAAQALAYILDLPEWRRIMALQGLLNNAETAAHCFVMDHAGAVEQLKAVQIRERRYRDALDKIGRMTSRPDYAETPAEEAISRIAAEALVQR